VFSAVKTVSRCGILPLPLVEQKTLSLTTESLWPTNCTERSTPFAGQLRQAYYVGWSLYRQSLLGKPIIWVLMDVQNLK